MRLHRFYIKDLVKVGRAILVTDSDVVHQWKNVFRMKVKSNVILFGGEGIEYQCEILSLDKKSASLEVISEKKGMAAKREITLCSAIIKKDNFETIIQKAVELGATTIIPIVSDRSEKKFLNMERAEKIVIEAIEQCGRVDIPTLCAPMTFSDCLNSISKDTKIIGFEPTGSPFDVKIFHSQRIALFVGPEGGWTEEEIKQLEKSGTVMSLPTFILRAETAAIAGLALAAILA